MPRDPATTTRRERAAARRARRRRRQGAVAAGMLVLPLAVTAWGIQQPRPQASGGADDPGAGRVTAAALTTALTTALSSAAATRARPVDAVESDAADAPPGPPPARPEPRLAAEGQPRPFAARGTGRLVPVPGVTRRSGRGPLLRYAVEVEEGIGEDLTAFAGAVDATLADPRSWGAGGRLSFQRVASGPVDFRVTLASPATTDRLCAPLHTDGLYSCHNEGRAVINGMRWARGAEAYGGDLAGYRRYVVNHEVGHYLGHGHEDCAGPGRAAPVMMQQTIGVGACRSDPWPYATG